jgi:hypothetical protein
LAVFPNGEGWLFDNFQPAAARKLQGLGAATVVLEGSSHSKVLTTSRSVEPEPERLRLLTAMAPENPLTTVELSGPARTSAPLRWDRSGALIGIELANQTGELWRVEVSP